MICRYNRTRSISRSSAKLESGASELRWKPLLWPLVVATCRGSFARQTELRD
jgi:hypothetical protein